MNFRAGYFGLERSVLDSLYKIFESTAAVEEVVIFGSRAKGNFLEGSDIDLAVKGNDVSFDTVLALMDKTEDLGLLYKIDIQNHGSITDTDVLEHIHRVGKVFWKRRLN